jgi:hypothetical protein
LVLEDAPPSGEQPKRGLLDNIVDLVDRHAVTSE